MTSRRADTDAERESVDVDAVADAVRGTQDVLDLSGGRVGEVATYLPGRRVAGVRIDDNQVSVHVSVRYGRPLPDIAEKVRQAVRPLAAGREVLVAVDEVRTAEELAVQAEREAQAQRDAARRQADAEHGSTTSSAANTTDDTASGGRADQPPPGPGSNPAPSRERVDWTPVTTTEGSTTPVTGATTRVTLPPAPPQVL